LERKWKGLLEGVFGVLAMISHFPKITALCFPSSLQSPQRPHACLPHARITTTTTTTTTMGESCNCKGGSSTKLGFCPFSLVLFAGTAFTYVTYLQNKSKKKSITTTDEPFRVVFVLGGPGAGKGTQCELLSKNHGWAHLSAGDLLRAERKKEGSQLATIINTNIQAGKIVPSEITTQLIYNAMVELRQTYGQIKFLIDGFPRSEGNVNSWKEIVGNTAILEYVLFFECPFDILTSRLLERGKTSGRSDDSLVSCYTLYSLDYSLDVKK
jgi:UMP-CMP kinase